MLISNLITFFEIQHGGFNIMEVRPKILWFFFTDLSQRSEIETPGVFESADFESGIFHKSKMVDDPPKILRFFL